MTPRNPSEPVPYFGEAGIENRDAPRLLLITWAFAPDAGIGALRWHKLSRYFAEWGWELDVITRDPAQITAADPGRLAELPPGIRLFAVRSPTLVAEHVSRVVLTVYAWLRAQTSKLIGRTSVTPGARDPGHDGTRSPPSDSLGRLEIRWSATVRSLVRAFHAWLDYRRSERWARAAASVAMQVVERGLHRAVVTSGPPHMAHEAGRIVSRATGLPFVMDLRDPWSLLQRLPESLASPVWFQLANRYERRAVAQASLIVTNTEPFRLAMVGRHPAARNRMLTVMNGWDDDPVPPADRDERFIIAFAGEIYMDRDPRPLFRATARLVSEFDLRPSDLGIEFLGQVESFGARPVADIADEEGVGAFVRLWPPRPRQEALKFLAKATLLVSLPQDWDLAVPAKIFEYAQFDAWVLALANPDSATGTLLRDTDADVVPPNDLEGILRAIRARFLEFRSGKRPLRIARDGRFSRRPQAERLFDALASLTGWHQSSREVVDRRASTSSTR